MTTVSVVMPIRNEEKHIEQCISSLLRQDYPEVEILLVDGMSEDKTREIIGRFASQRIRLLDNPGKTAPCAMNIGIRAARGEVIVRMDAHCEYAGDYITRCVETLGRTGAANVGGPMIAAGRGRIGRAFAHIHACVFGLGGGKFHDPHYEGPADTVFLGAFDKRSLLDAGLYDERLTRNQDIELNARIRKSGGLVYITPDIKSTYYCRDSLGKIASQNYLNGKWNIFTSTINNRALSLRHFVPMLFVLSVLLLSVPGVILRGAFVWPPLAVVGLYLLGDLFFSAGLAKKHGASLFPLYLIIFPVLHVAYGFGSLAGLLGLRGFVRRSGEREKKG